jgi:hypothetical protein
MLSIRRLMAATAASRAISSRSAARSASSIHFLNPSVTGVGVFGCTVGVAGELKKKLRSLI